MSNEEYAEPVNWREGRRQRAGELFQQGWTQAGSRLPWA